MFKTKKGALVPKTTSSKSKSNRKAHEHAVPEPGIPVTVAAELLVELITGLDWRIMEEMFFIWTMREGEFNKGDYPSSINLAGGLSQYVVEQFQALERKAKIAKHNSKGGRK